MSFAIPTICTVLVAAAFLILERVLPARELPHAPGWYARAILINAAQVVITFGTNRLWVNLLSSASLFDLAALPSAVFQGLIGWFVGTFFFYWWHRIRHIQGFWVVLHQVHHSPVRIEAMTAFYKHPVEILADSALAAVILYPLLGSTLEGALWFNFFAASGELLYHSNIRTPRWVKYIIQTPELHSIHHQLDVHRFNFADLPLWDRLFGTYCDTEQFAEHCGFPRHNERQLGRMLIFKDVYKD